MYIDFLVLFLQHVSNVYLGQAVCYLATVRRVLYVIHRLDIVLMDVMMRTPLLVSGQDLLVN